MSIDELFQSTELTASDSGNAGTTAFKYILDSLIESFPDPVLVVNDEGVLTHWNSGMAEMHGIPPKEAIGKQAYDVVGTDGESETLAETVVRTGEAVREDKIRSGVDNDDNRWHIRAKCIPLKDDKGTVVGAFEVTARVTEIVEQRKQIERMQERMSEDVMASIADLEEYAAEVSNSSKQISSKIDRQAQSLESVTDEVSSFSATIEEVASTVAEVNRQSDRTMNDARESRQMGEEVATTIDDLNEAAHAVEHSTSKLSDHVEQVDEIITAITDIADQTNLLALNANIEAARAGQKGNGFAVVANEVKQLAEESKQEASEITQIVEDVRQNTDTTVSEIQNTVAQLDVMTEEVQQLIEKQTEIVDAVQQTSDRLEEITEATDDQAANAEEIASMIDESTEMANEVQSLFDNVRGANEEIVTNIQTIHERVEDVTGEIKTDE